MVKRYANPRHDAESVQDTFAISDGEMSVTEIIVTPMGYSWRQWCPWPDYARELLEDN